MAGTIVEGSILTETKKMLGLVDEDTTFDTDIIIDINSSLSILSQLGIGPKDGYSIKDKNDTWDNIIDDAKNLELIKTWLYMKVRLMFDPPLNGTVLNSMNSQLNELEWRISVAQHLD